jgi:hypothetical protein
MRTEMITNAKNKAVKNHKKKVNEGPEFGNEKQCPHCGRTNFARIVKCSICGRVSCDRCSANQTVCNCKVDKNA